MDKAIVLSKQKREDTSFARKYGAFIVLLLMIVVNMIITPNFLSMGTLWNIVIQSCTILLTGMGMTMVVSSGGIDISVGSMMAMGAMCVAKFLPLGIFPAIVLSLVICMCLGTFTGFMIAKLKIQPMIMTLAMMMSVRGIAQVINDAMLLYVSDPIFSQLGTGRVGGIIPNQLFIIIAVVLLVYFIMKKTTLGHYIQAVGDNPQSARLAGVNTVKTIIIVYVLCAAFAGLAGIIETAKISAADGNAIGKLAELDAIAAVAVGGTSMSGGKARVLGTVIGALIMQLITIMVNMNNIPFEVSQVIKSIVIIIAVFLQRGKRS